MTNLKKTLEDYLEWKNVLIRPLLKSTQLIIFNDFASLTRKDSSKKLG